MPNRYRSAAFSASIALPLILGLCACQANAGAPPESPVSASSSDAHPPSVSATGPAEAAEAKNVAEAKRRYLEFQEITTESAQKGVSPFSELMSGGYIGSSELQSQQQSFWEQYTDLNLKQVGEAGIDVVEVTKYEGDPLRADVTGQRVYMTVCVDNSDRDVINPDGTTALRKDSPNRVLMKAVMQGQKEDGIWSLNENKSTGKKC